MPKPFKPKPYDAERKEQTEAQRAATDRNFGIFRLRGLWYQAALLDEPFRAAMQGIIDTNLIQRGSLPQREHERAMTDKRLRAVERKRQRDNPGQHPSSCLCDDCLDIPF